MRLPVCLGLHHKHTATTFQRLHTEAAEKGDDALLGELITDKMIQALCVVGDTESCIKQIQEIIDAGGNTPASFPVPGTNPVESAKIIGKEITPYLK